MRILQLFLDSFSNPHGNFPGVSSKNSPEVSFEKPPEVSLGNVSEVPGEILRSQAEQMAQKSHGSATFGCSKVSVSYF